MESVIAEKYAVAILQVAKEQKTGTRARVILSVVAKDPEATRGFRLPRSFASTLRMTVS